MKAAKLQLFPVLYSNPITSVSWSLQHSLASSTPRRPSPIWSIALLLWNSKYLTNNSHWQWDPSPGFSFLELGIAPWFPGTAQRWIWGINTLQNMDSAEDCAKEDPLNLERKWGLPFLPFDPYRGSVVKHETTAQCGHCSCAALR